MLKDLKIDLQSKVFNILFLVFVFIFTFPSIEPDFSPGLDSSFNWAYNYLFINNYDFLVDIVHAYGPLGFLKKPIALGNNFLLSTIFYSLLKILLIGGFIWLKPQHNKKVNYLFILILAYFLNIDLLFVGLSFISAYFFIKTNNYWFYVALCILSIITFYIKISIGLMCLPLIFFSWFNFIKPLKLKPLGVCFGIFLLSFLSCSYLLTDNVFHIFIHLNKVLQISNHYSSAFAIHPDNNWFWLTLFILSIVVLPFFKSKKTTFLLILLLPSLYGMWKQAIVREDFSHYSQLLDYAVLFWFVIIVFSPLFKKNKLFYFIPLISLLSLHFNLKNANPQNKKYSKEISGVYNFEQTIFSHNQSKESFLQASNEKISVNRLSDSLRAVIGNKSIDIYPWDLTYITANDFNWQPRTTLQTICLSDEHDKIAAKNFNTQNGPEYILFHHVYDTSAGVFGSIDYRYLLNDEPLTNVEIFKNYSPSYLTERYTLLKKNNMPAITQKHKGELFKLSWGKWIESPKLGSNKILKLEIKPTKSFLEKTIQFLYKDADYYIDYSLASGKVISYRLIPSIAQNGIWVNPLLKSFNNNPIEEEVLKIRLRKNSNLNKKEIDACWVFYGGK